MNHDLRLLLFYRLPAWIWGIAMFIGTSIPGDYLPSIIVLTPDKLLHSGAFFGLTILVYRALNIDNNGLSLRRRFFATTLYITLGYGVFDELHQHFIPGRQPDVFDFLADAVGVGLAIIVVTMYLKFSGRKRKRIESQETVLP